MLNRNATKLNILYSCPLDLVERTAPAYHVINVVRELAKLNYTIDLVHQGEQRTDIDDINQFALALNRKTLLGRASSDLKYYHAIKLKLKSTEYNWIYHRLEKWTVLPLLLYKFRGIPVVLEFNSDVQAELRSNNNSWLYRKIYSFSEWIQVNCATRIVAVSQGIEHNLKENYPKFSDCISAIENGTDTSTFHPKDRIEACKEIELDPIFRYVTFAGSLQTWQGLETIVECAPIVLENTENVRFLIIGGGSCAEKIETLIQSMDLEIDVLMIGWQSGERLASYLAASEVCLAPYSAQAALDTKDQQGSYSTSLMKCSPLKIFTYMAMKKPVVASDFADGGHRLLQWGTGLSFEPDNKEQLANAIVKLLSDEELAQKLGQNGYDRVQKLHTWNCVAKQIESFCFDSH